MVIGFWELPKEDQPPQDIWLDSELLVDWFNMIRERKRDEQSGMETIPLDQNELTQGLK